MLILASASPRRRQLLQMLGLEFEARPQLCREQSQSRDPADYVTDIALQKAQSAQAQAGPEDWILAADTAVCLDGQILGKPTDLEDARRMLALLGGKIHQVHTGLCLLRGQRIWRWQERTDVEFYPLSQQLIAGISPPESPWTRRELMALRAWAPCWSRAFKGIFTM